MLADVVPGESQIVGPAPVGTDGAQDATPGTSEEVAIIMEPKSKRSKSLRPPGLRK